MFDPPNINLRGEWSGPLYQTTISWRILYHIVRSMDTYFQVLYLPLIRPPIGQEKLFVLILFPFLLIILISKMMSTQHQYEGEWSVKQFLHSDVPMTTLLDYHIMKNMVSHCTQDGRISSGIVFITNQATDWAGKVTKTLICYCRCCPCVFLIFGWERMVQIDSFNF